MLFYLGRGLDYDLAMEGSLKIKEISYIHAEAFAAGELKHGTIALIEKGTPVNSDSNSRRVIRKNGYLTWKKLELEVRNVIAIAQE